MSKMNKKAVLFDLDGTLVDTYPDFVRILTKLCADEGLPPPSKEAIRKQVSAGARAMVGVCFADEFCADNPAHSRFHREFLHRYERDVCVDSRLFDGFDTLLAQLDVKGVAWGVVTNKPRHLSLGLLQALNLVGRLGVLVCPEDVSITKPDPEGLLLACDTLGVSPVHVLYAGDHERDVLAGNNANMTTAAALYGYVDDDPATWGADFDCQTPNELVCVIERFLALDNNKGK